MSPPYPVDAGGMGGTGHVRRGRGRVRQGTLRAPARRVRQALGESMLMEMTRDASHDLRASLRGIRHYTSFLLEDHESRLDPPGQAMLRNLADLSVRADAQMKAFTHFTRLSLGEMADDPVDLNCVLAEARVGLEL